MDGTFRGATSFNQDIGNWNVGKVYKMENMFEKAISFNYSIDSWNVSEVRYMDNMFDGASSFNHSINSWDVSRVIVMREMFKDATSFNGSLNSWNVRLVIAMDNMFNGASSFNQDLGYWNVSGVQTMSEMFKDSGLLTEMYDSILIGWSTLPILQENVSLGTFTMTYCNGKEARQKIIENYNWVIDDGGFTANCSPLSIDYQRDVTASFDIYPLPVGDLLLIRGSEELLNVLIYDMFGKIVLSKKKTNRINVKELRPGIYLTKLSFEGAELNRKFIKL